MRVLIYSISSQALPVVVPGALAVGLVEEDGLPGLLADVPGALDKPVVEDSLDTGVELPGP